MHLNPVRAGLLRPEQPLQAYPWSSYPLYLHEGARPEWLRIDRLLGEWGLRWDAPGAGARFGEVMEARRHGELEEEFKPVRRAWCLGSQPFRAELLKYVEAQRARWHYGQELGEAAEAKAERLIGAALQTDGVSAEQLARWPKGHPFKLRLARRLRAETTVTVGWISQRLGMGSRAYLAHLLCRPEPPPQSGLPTQPLLGI